MITSYKGITSKHKFFIYPKKLSTNALRIVLNNLSCVFAVSFSCKMSLHLYLRLKWLLATSYFALHMSLPCWISMPFVVQPIGLDNLLYLPQATTPILIVLHVSLPCLCSCIYSNWFEVGQNNAISHNSKQFSILPQFPKNAICHIILSFSTLSISQYAMCSCFKSLIFTLTISDY